MKAVAIILGVLIVLLSGAVVYGLLNPPTAKLAALPQPTQGHKLTLPAQNLVYAGPAGSGFVVEGTRDGTRVLFLINPENPTAYTEIGPQNR